MAVKMKSKPKKSKKSAELVPPPALEPIETLPTAHRSMVTIDVDLDTIDVDEGPNRAAMEDQASIEELARTMARQGQLQNIGVTVTDAEPERYRLVWGHRRVAAARRRGWKSLKASVWTFDTEQELVVTRGIENIHRRDLTPVDESLVVAHVVGVYETQLTLGPTAEPPAGEQPNLPVSAKHAAAARAGAVKKAAVYFGKSEQWVRDRVFLARLDEADRELVATGRLPLGHAREIAKLADPAVRQSLARFAAANKDREFPMPFDELKHRVAQNLLSLAQVPWRLDVPFAGAPACVECPHNSANEPGLFESGVLFSRDKKETLSKWGAAGKSEPAAGVCTNQACYRRKASAAAGAVRNAAARAVTEVNKLPAKERPKTITPASVYSLVAVAPHLNPATVAAMARQKLEAKPGKSSSSSTSSSYHSKPDPRHVAEDKLRNEMEKRCKHVEELLGPLFARDPLAWAAFKTFMEHPLTRKTQDRGAGNKIIGSTGFVALLRQLADHDVEGIASGCNRKLDLFSPWYDGPSGLAEAVAKAFGIDVEEEIGPRPKLEDYLPRSEPTKGIDVGAKPSAKSGKKKAAGNKSKKAKAGVCMECESTQQDLDEANVEWADEDQNLCQTCAEEIADTAGEEEGE